MTNEKFIALVLSLLFSVILIYTRSNSKDGRADRKTNNIKKIIAFNIIIIICSALLGIVIGYGILPAVPVTGTLNTPTSSPTIYIVELNNFPGTFEAVENKQPGELIIDYPGMMSIGSSDVIFLEINVLPSNIQEEITRRAKIRTPSPISEYPGERAYKNSYIFIDDNMKIEIEAPNFKVSTKFQFSGSMEDFPWYWQCSIVAPEIPGNQVFTIHLLFDGVTNPIWTGNFPIIIIDPGQLTKESILTPDIFNGVPTSTMIPSPIVATPTLSSSFTHTPIPIPTKVFREKIIDSLIAGAAEIVTGLLLIISGLIATSLFALRSYLIRRDKILEIEENIKNNPDRLQSEVLLELAKLKKIKWWHFWKYPRKSDD